MCLTESITQSKLLEQGHKNSGFTTKFALVLKNSVSHKIFQFTTKNSVFEKGTGREREKNGADHKIENFVKDRVKHTQKLF